MKSLYEYQEKQINQLLNSPTRWVRMVGPTGSGKSAVMQCAQVLAVESGKFSKAVTLVPAIVIEEAFCRAESYSFSDGTVIETPAQTWVRARNVGLDFESPEKFVIATHNKAARLDKPDIDFKSMLFVVDEAHHHGEGTALYDFLVWVHDRGASVWDFTATPERSNRARLNPPDVELTVHVLSQVQLMRMGWPKKVRLNTVRMSTPVRERAAGKLLAQDYETLVRLIKETDRQTLVCVTPGYSVLLAKELEEELTRTGYDKNKILIATGDDFVGTESRSSYVDNRIAEDKALLEAGRWREITSCVIDCRRCAEGVDMPALSRVIQYGVPTSLVLVIQRIGRTLRRKDNIPGFPKDWAESVEFIAAVPDSGDDFEAKRRATEQFVQIACYLNSPDTAYDYMILWDDIIKGQRLPPRSARKVQALVERTPDDAVRIRKVLLELGVSVRGGPAPTLNVINERIRRYVEKNVDGTTEEQIEEALVLLDEVIPLAAQVEPKVLDRFRSVTSAALGGVSRDSAEDSTICRKLLESYEQVCREFAHLVVPIQSQFFNGLTGILGPDEIENIGQRLVTCRDAVFDIEFDEIIRIINTFKKSKGRAPGTLTNVDDELTEYVGFKYFSSDLNRSIARRWPGMTLRHVIHAARDWPSWWRKGAESDIIRKVKESWPRYRGKPAPVPDVSKISDAELGLKVLDVTGRTKAGRTAVIALAFTHGWCVEKQNLSEMLSGA